MAVSFSISTENLIVICSDARNLLSNSIFVEPVGGDYFVLNTNYTDYASVYSCSKSDDGTITECGWVLTRHRDYSDELVSYKSPTFFPVNLSF